VNPQRLNQQSATEWRIEPHDAMRVPGIFFAPEAVIRAMDEAVYQQVVRVATLPGVVEAVYVWPNVRCGQGFPQGGVAAFDPEQGGVIVSSGVSGDVGWGVRVLRTGLSINQLLPCWKALHDTLHSQIPNGNGVRVLRLTRRGIDAMLRGGARWAVEMGYGLAADLERIEEGGCVAGADASQVSDLAKARHLEEMGTLRFPQQYLKVHVVSQIYDHAVAQSLALHLDDVLVSIRCGSHSLGQQISLDSRRRLAAAGGHSGITLSDQHLVCAPLTSEAGRHYLGAMRASANCAHANRQILTHLARRVFNRFFPEARLEVLYDVSYHTGRLETHQVDGQARLLHVHRQGVSRALGPGHPDLPAAWRELGQLGLISSGFDTAFYLTVAAASEQERAFGSFGYGLAPEPLRAGREQSRRGLEQLAFLQRLGNSVWGPAPGEATATVSQARAEVSDCSGLMEAAVPVGLTRCVARLKPLIHINSVAL